MALPDFEDQHFLQRIILSTHPNAVAIRIGMCGKAGETISRFKGKYCTLCSRYVCDSEKERLEVPSESGRKIEFKFEFSLPTCQLIEWGRHF